MKITIELLKEKGACKQGIKDFEKNYPDGCDYQKLLDACAEKDKDDYAIFLMAAFGSTDTVLEIDGDYESEHSLFFAGEIKCSGLLKAKRSIRAGYSINAGRGVRAGGDIRAGWGIHAGRNIKADGGICADGDINASGDINAGRGVRAGGDINAGGSIKADEDIHADRSIKADGGIYAGRGVHAGVDINAGRNINAGYGINADGNINTGYDFGIYAGLRCCLSDKTRRTIKAKTKPANIVCGIWYEDLYKIRRGKEETK